VYVSGGYEFLDGSAAIVGGLFAYNPLTDQKTQKTDMPLRTADGVTGVISGRLHVLPGACSGEGYPTPGYCAVEPIRRFYRYDPATDTWVTRRSCPHFHRSAGGGVINGKFYVVGGSNDKGVATATLDVYDPVTNTWITRAPMPAAAAFVKATVLQNKLFVVTSANGGQGLKAYAYDPVTNTWRTRAAPPTWGALARIQLDGHVRVLSVGGSGEVNAPPVASQLYTP
jgi:N-acetylneuraminic acid mutarotase